MHKYLPHTPSDIEKMLKVIKANSLDEMFMAIPENLRLKKDYNMPNMMSDDALSKHMLNLSLENKQLTVFRGAGSYDHYTPSIVKTLISRQEFLTSYTPYQPEVAQGTLQYIFEYQSMVCELTDMDVSNASMYDGSTATAEAMFMAYAQTNKSKILISETVHPRTIEVVKTYAKYRDISVELVKMKNGVTNKEMLIIDDQTMGLIVQNPNYYGIIENYDGFADVLHEKNALLIMNADGQALSLIKTPGELDADIAVGDLQSLGVPMSFGGAYIGYLATKKKHMRKMPGRICGITKDVDGKRAFVLTLQAREQHIRRAKANSNICSNQSLLALAVTIYMATMGKQGMIDVANESMKGAYYLYQELLKTKRFEVVYEQPFFKEFVLKANFDVSLFEEDLLKENILGPLHLGNNHLMFAVTERRTKAEIDKLIEMVVMQP